MAPFFINRYLAELGPDIVHGRQVVNVPREMGRFLNLLNRAVLHFESAKMHPDVLHETYFTSPESVWGRDVPRVITVHDMIHEKFPDYFSSRDRTSVRKLQAVERADHIICVSNNTRNDLLEISGVPPTKVSVVHHGYERKSLPQVSPGFSGQAPYILYVGLRGGYKNFSGLLGAYAANSFLKGQFRLVCFGGGKFRRSELGYIKSLGLEPGCVDWVGGSDEELTAYYAHAAAFVYPSLYEGFGMPLLEAMDAGCPVVCSNTGSIPEVAEDAAEFFDPMSIESISLALQRVVSSDARSVQLRNNGYRRLADFSWESCAERTLAAYHSVA
jgi:glycosyltransferase involved in cell wall biosynthesis